MTRVGHAVAEDRRIGAVEERRPHPGGDQHSAEGRVTGGDALGHQDHVRRQPEQLGGKHPAGAPESCDDVMSSLLAVSTVAHVPANVLWLSRAARSAVRRTGRVLGDTILDHYTTALVEIARTGFFEYWSREFRPYLRGAAEQFAPAHESLTERLMKRD